MYDLKCYFSIGGVYPLSSASAFEGDLKTASQPIHKKEDIEVAEIANEGRMRAGLAIFWQQPGQMLPYWLCLLLHAIYKNSNEELQFRIILGVGCTFPLGVLTHIAIKSNFMFGFDQAKVAAAGSSSGTSSLINLPAEFWALMKDPKVRKPLLGCMICWALLDIYIYSKFFVYLFSYLSFL